MKKQKRGFINFICSLIPGAGEMNMGFEKQGISIMIVFWGIASAATLTGFAWLLVMLPIVWFYSFFHTHNLKNMTEEAFLLEEDRYLFSLDYMMANKKELFEKYHTLIAGLLIFVGVCIVGNEVMDVFFGFVPDFMYDVVYNITNLISAGIVGVGAIVFGILMLHKKEKEEEER